MCISQQQIDHKASQLNIENKRLSPSLSLCGCVYVRMLHKCMNTIFACVAISVIVSAFAKPFSLRCSGKQTKLQTQNSRPLRRLPSRLLVRCRCLDGTNRRSSISTQQHSLHISWIWVVVNYECFHSFYRFYCFYSFLMLLRYLPHNLSENMISLSKPRIRSN